MARTRDNRLQAVSDALGADNGKVHGVMTVTRFKNWKQSDPEGQGALLVVPDALTVDEWQAAAAEWSKVLPGLVAKAYQSECEMVQPTEADTLPKALPDTQDPPTANVPPKKKRPSLSPLAAQKRREKNAANWRETVRRW